MTLDERLEKLVATVEELERKVSRLVRDMRKTRRQWQAYINRLPMQ